MAKLYISSILVGCFGIYLILACTSLNSGEAVQSAPTDFGYGARILENAFNPIVKQMIGASLELFSQMTQIAHSLSTSGLTPEVTDKISNTLQTIDTNAKTLKLQYSLLLGLILWPLAFLILPVGCCLAVILCCVVAVVVGLVVGLLLIVGTILYSGPLAGNIPQEATHVVGTLVETLASVSNETLDAVSSMVLQGHSGQAVPVLNTMQHMVTAFGSIAGQLQMVLIHPQISAELTESVNGVLGSVSSYLACMGVQTSQLAAQLPISAAGINATIHSLIEHIEQVHSKLA